MTSARRQRWVHVFATFGKGGPQVRAVQLMQRAGPGVEHVVMAMDGSTGAAELAGGLSLQVVAPPPRGGLWATMRRQRTWLRAERPDLVLTYNWGAIESVWAARSLRLPLVHHEDGFLPDEVAVRHRRRNWLRRWLLRKVPVVVPSTGLLAIATREWGMQHAQHLPNGVDLMHFQPTAHAPSPEFVFGTVGGLRPEKDHATLLRAIAQVPGVRLLVVGDGPLRASLQTLANELGVADRVEFAGATHDTAAQYRRMDAFVLSSCTEQMPLVLLEAMAAGLPVVATDVGDVARVLPASAQPFVVPPGRPEELAKAMARLSGAPQKAGELARDNRQRVAEHYEGAQCLDRFLAVYRAALVRA